MYKHTFVPDKKNHSINLPEEFYGKKVEVIVIEVEEETFIKPVAKLPKGKKVAVDQLLETFGSDLNFPSIEEIRNNFWPSKW
ncbi:MAG: hypothetical protein V5804_07685 [Mucilaginibacter sp.]|uniref:hypothetical protein n=1 Tax=Mucilaginibacter sp. TaxID=1882438 RepID=UPI0034E52A37